MSRPIRIKYSRFKSYSSLVVWLKPSDVSLTSPSVGRYINTAGVNLTPYDFWLEFYADRSVLGFHCRCWKPNTLNTQTGRTQRCFPPSPADTIWASRGAHFHSACRKLINNRVEPWRLALLPPWVFCSDCISVEVVLFFLFVLSHRSLKYFIIKERHGLLFYLFTARV